LAFGQHDFANGRGLSFGIFELIEVGFENGYLRIREGGFNDGGQRIIGGLQEVNRAEQVNDVAGALSFPKAMQRGWRQFEISLGPGQLGSQENGERDDSEKRGFELPHGGRIARFGAIARNFSRKRTQRTWLKVGALRENFYVAVEY
jgi:hypothetical protein